MLAQCWQSSIGPLPPPWAKAALAHCWQPSLAHCRRRHWPNAGPTPPCYLGRLYCGIWTTESVVMHKYVNTVIIRGLFIFQGILRLQSFLEGKITLISFCTTSWYNNMKLKECWRLRLVI
jgi:hypothetical protein